MVDLPDDILQRVTKPARYTNNEINAVTKDLSGVDVKVALAFPDVYEIGMSNLGLRILYEILNRRADTAAERVFAPWPDMETLMRERRIPLFTLESRTPVAEFDILGFSLAYELTYTNVLNMLDLSGIPVQASLRGNQHPMVIAGGCCTYNPEPMAQFIDAFVIGEGEEIIHDLIEVFKSYRHHGRDALLGKMAEIEGVYVPSHSSGKSIRKRIVRELDISEYTERPIVPFVETIHDRATVEVMRGCSRGCRFCQAGMVYRPVRERSVETLLAQAQRLISCTGYDEIGLLSLSTADYSRVEDLVRILIQKYESRRIGVSLPSLRADAPCVELASQIQRVRKSGLTLAPEAGTQRLRNVINKNVTEGDLLDAVETAFKWGWRTIKLYFMIGLPTETDEDVLEIARLTHKVTGMARQMRIRPTVNVSISTFVPKPHTPFQWRPQDTIDEIKRKQSLLRGAIRDKAIQLSWHDAKASALEGVLSRGDRKVGEVILRAWQRGCKFDAWDEHFRYEEWMRAFSECGVDPAYHANRARSYDEPLPWDHIDCGVSKRFLMSEDMRANEAQVTPDCRLEGCVGCGVAVLAGGCPSRGKVSAEPSLARAGSSDESKGSTIPQETSKMRPRIMVALTKGEPVRYISHLSYFRSIELALRRASIPVAYSEGFNPRPRVSFGSAIGVGVTSDDERMVIELASPQEVDNVIDRLNKVLPNGIRVAWAEIVPEGVKSALRGLNASLFRFTVASSPGYESGAIEKAIQDMLARKELCIRRVRADKLREVDIRSHLVSAYVVQFFRDYFEIEAVLKSGDSGGAGPGDFVEALRMFMPNINVVKIHRVKQLGV